MAATAIAHREDVRRDVARRPRVVHVVRSYGEISETFIADGIQAIDEAGWETWVVAGSVKRRDWFPFPPDERVLEARRPGASRRALDRLALRSSADRRSRGLEPAIATARPALVHAHFGWGAADARLASRRLGLPLVATFRGADLTIFPGYKRFYRDYRRVFRQLGRAICISEFLAAKLRSYGYERRIDIVPSGIRLEAFPFRGALVEGDAVRLLYVGRQVPYKGVDVLVRALALAAREEPALTLDVVGDGPCRPENERLARELGVERRVTWHGAQPRAGVLEALRRAHVFVMPSRTTPSGQAEGLGNVSKEALAVGVQVIATANGGIPETIPPGQRDELVSEGDPRALADRIVALVRARDVWPRRAAEGRAWVEREFDWRRLAARIADIYDEVLDEGGRQ